MTTLKTTLDGKSNAKRWVGWEAEGVRMTAKTMTIDKTEATTTMVAVAVAATAVNPLRSGLLS